MVSRVDITAEDIKAYQRDGAVLIKRALAPDMVRLLEQGIEEAHQAPTHQYSKVTSYTGEGETTVKQFVSQRSPALRSLMESGIVGEIGARLMQAPSAQLILDQIFYKAKGPIAPTPWHQDTGFLRVRGDELVRVWMPCDFSPRDLTVQVVRGSHRWNVVYDTKISDAEKTTTIEAADDFSNEGTGDPRLPPPPDVARYRDSFDILGWDVEPGDALVFHGNIIHGTDGHPGHDRPRRAFAVMMGGPNLRYHAPRGKAFPAPIKTEGVSIPHGDSIGNHDDAFPICWRVAA